MGKNELKHLGRRELLELLVRQSRELDTLREKLAQAERKLEDRRLLLEKSGSLAEAALSLNGVFEAAQKACDQYTENIRLRAEATERYCRELEEKTRQDCDRLREAARRGADGPGETEAPTGPEKGGSQ